MRDRRTGLRAALSRRVSPALALILLASVGLGSSFVTWGLLIGPLAVGGTSAFAAGEPSAGVMRVALRPDLSGPPEQPADGSLHGPPRPPPVAAARARPREELEVASGKIPRGGTLSGSLRAQGVSPATIHRIVETARPVFDFRRAAPGDGYTLAQRPDGALVEFTYRYSPFESVRVVRKDGELVAEREELEVRRRRARIAGVIRSSFYDAILELDASPQLAQHFVDIFAWDVDFSRAVQPGDEFAILYERRYRVDGSREILEGPGRILAARYTDAQGPREVVYFETEDGHGGYYRPDGSSVQRQFLAAPLRYSRISSSYTHSRWHPILKVSRPHHGIDYAAPRGTPVWAVADGVVSFRGRNGGFGRLVKIRHPNGYESYYAHLSRYADGLHPGLRVEQKQIIGYVGASGLATGPHVCFRVARNGRYVNPRSVESPAGPPVPEEQLPEFATRRDELLRELDGSPELETLEAL